LVHVLAAAIVKACPDESFWNPTLDHYTAALRPSGDRQRRHRAASLVEQATKAAAKDAPSITTAKKS
jgi:hypothetical protein